MTTTIEKMKEVGDLFAEGARKMLSEQGWIMPVVVTVKDNDIGAIIGIPDIPTGQEKAAAYQQLAGAIRQQAPDAVIIINDSYMRQYPAEEGEEAVKNYKPGDLSMDQEAVECIIIAFKGPAIRPHLLTFPYHRDGLGDIVFDKCIVDGWQEHAQINLLPDWW